MYTKRRTVETTVLEKGPFYLGWFMGLFCAYRLRIKKRYTLRMVAPTGNEFWKARSSHGRKPLFSEPEVLWVACCEYFQSVADNPLKKTELVKFQGAAKAVEVPLMRAMTIAGLCIFLDIAERTWDNYRAKDDEVESGETFADVCARVDSIIRTQKFEGAAAGLLDQNIISRDLNLVDKKDHTGRLRVGHVGRIIDKNMTENDASELYADFLREDDDD